MAERRPALILMQHNDVFRLTDDISFTPAIHYVNPSSWISQATCKNHVIWHMTCFQVEHWLLNFILAAVLSIAYLTKQKTIGHNIIMPSRKHTYIILIPLAPLTPLLYSKTGQAILTSTYNLCFEQKYEKISEFFIWKLSIFGGEIFNIFEKVCFRNGLDMSNCVFVDVLLYLRILQRHNKSILLKHVFITKKIIFKYRENITSKTWKLSDKKKLWYFSYFCSKHRLWVVVKTVLVRRF